MVHVPVLPKRSVDCQLGAALEIENKKFIPGFDRQLLATMFLDLLERLTCNALQVCRHVLPRVA